MTISCRWRTYTLWTLKPSHGNRVKCMQVSEYFTFSSSSSKYDNLRPRKNCWVSIPWSRWSSWNFRFGKLVCVNVKNVSVVQVSISFGFSSKIVSSKNNDWSPWQCGWMSSSRTGTHTFDDGISPLPSSNLELSIGVLTWWLLRGLTLALLSALFALGLALLMTVFGMLWLLHLFHVWTLLLFLLIFVRVVSLVRLVLFGVIRLIIAFHMSWVLYNQRNFNYKFNI